VSEFVSVLFGADEIAARVKELAGEITRDYAGEELYLVGALKGGVPFMSDLARHIDLPAVMFDFIGAASYDGTESTGEVRIYKELDNHTKGKNVLIIDDIMDTGKTVAEIAKIVRAQGPKSLKTCVLLDKPERRTEEGLNPDYTGFTIPNKFVVGYGLDYNERYRNLPYVGVLSFRE
jgi:hypoxanthine phosphoribosyltransferase